jgi:hypothetical protein
MLIGWRRRWEIPGRISLGFKKIMKSSLIVLGKIYSSIPMML